MARPKKEKPNARGLYEVTISLGKDLTGKLIRKHFYSTISKEHARQKAEDWKVEQAVALQTGRYKAKDITFREFAEIIRENKKPTLKYSSWNTSIDIPIRNHFIPFFGNVLLKNIKKIDIERYFISKKHLCVETLERHRTTLKLIFDEAVNNDYLVKNPMYKFKLSVGRQPRKKKVMSSEEMVYLLEYIHSNPSIITLAIDLLARYGMSRAELLGIKRDAIDLNNNIIYINQDVTVQNREVVAGETKNKYRKRAVAISQTTADLIRELEPELYTDYLISLDGGPMPPHKFQYRYTKAINDFINYYAKRGIVITAVKPHEMRHTRASIWVTDDKNLFAIAQQMGWSNLDMLQKRYGHADTEAVRKLLDI